MSRRSQARHWSRTAFILAVLFFTMAVGSRLVLGWWPFDGAPELSLLCVGLGIYFHIVARRFAALPDPTVLLDQAFQLAKSGRVGEAVALLSRAIGQSPHLWQAFQYRGELYLAQQNSQAAAGDFAAAIRLAPQERHLFELLEQATGPGGAVSDYGTTPASHDSEAR